MDAEIIISTYIWPWALRLCLLSLKDGPARLCVADDGSGPETRAMLQAFEAEFGVAVRHVWHEDKGFRKTAILNRAVASSDADFLIFTDGDCLWSDAALHRHLRMARPGYWGSGSLIRLTAQATQAVTEGLLTTGEMFSRPWLRHYGCIDRKTTWLKTTPLPYAAQAALDRCYPIRRTWMGSNAAAFRDAILAVNGFDETMAWGGEDKEFGIRLSNSGVKPRQMRFTTPILHLDHKRAYKDPEAIKRQRQMIQDARRQGKTWTDHGIT